MLFYIINHTKILNVFHYRNIFLDRPIIVKFDTEYNLGNVSKES